MISGREIAAVNVSDRLSGEWRVASSEFSFSPLATPPLPTHRSSPEARSLVSIACYAKIPFHEMSCQNGKWEPAKEQFVTPQLYTPTMFAELLEVSSAMVRQWHRRGWLRESAVVQKLSYFSPTELLPAKRLTQLAKNGLTNAEIAKQLAALQVLFPDLDRPIAMLDLRIDGRTIFLTKQGKLVDVVGQKRFDFAESDLRAGNATAEQNDDFPVTQIDLAFQTSDFGLQASRENFEHPPDRPKPDTFEELCRLAYHCEEQDRLDQAVEFFRAALAAGGPNATVCFQLGELLYRLDDKTAARERYYMAIELDEHFVEARATLGCVLAETGEPELAVSAFQGALLYHPDYADVHYHLGLTLQKLGRTIEAEQHLRRFRELMPDSPWAENEVCDHQTWEG